jgi:N-acetylmuramoyl-L-alanine amidase
MRIYYGKSFNMPSKILYNYSPNFSTSKRIKKNIKYLIFHYTGMNSENKAIRRLIDDSSKVSCHYFIKRNGQIILMVPDLYIAWHAGISYWNKDKLLNKNSIGIEISNKGHKLGYQNYSKAQIISVIKLSKHLIKKYRISEKNIVGHSDVAVDRKKDPGEKFPWKVLSKNGIGLWHNLNYKKLKKLRKKIIEQKDQKKFKIFLKSIGYLTKNLSNKNISKLIKSFQRRFRSELVSGKIDKECFVIAKKLSKLYN